MEEDWSEEFYTDDSFKRPGSIPFKWEIQPGIPKPHTPSANSFPLLPRLSPPPSKLTHSFSQPTNLYARSASASPSKRRSHSRDPRPFITNASPQLVVSMEGCLPVPSLKHRNKKKSMGARRTVMLSPPPSISARSSPSFWSPFRRTTHARDEMELATRWLF